MLIYLFSGGLEDSISKAGRSTLNRSSRMIADEFIQGPPQSNNITFVKATLGRKATIRCVAQNLVGQKTVSIYCIFMRFLSNLQNIKENLTIEKNLSTED